MIVQEIRQTGPQNLRRFYLIHTVEGKKGWISDYYVRRIVYLYNREGPDVPVYAVPGERETARLTNVYPVTIKEAVHRDLEASRSVYNFVRDLCIALGAAPDDLVPFEKYAAAAQGLTRPSSAARALFAGVPNIERADRLVQAIAAQKGRRNAVIDATVALVDDRLAANRKAAA